MKLKDQIKCLGMLFMTCLYQPEVWADTSAFTSGGYTTDQPPSFTGTKGWAIRNFVVSNYMAITQLGVFDSGGDGLANAHGIGLWAPDGTLLASTTVPAGTVAPLVDGYRYMPITPVLIPAGLVINNTAFIAAAYLAGDADDLVTPQNAGYATGVFPVSPYGLRTLAFFSPGTGLPFPAGAYYLPGCDPEAPCGRPPFLEVNFQFNIIQVPEPSVPLLFAPGLVYLYFRHRRFS